MINSRSSIHLGQARRRAKERLDSLHATQPDSTLATAQHQVAGELGFQNWAALVRDTERFDQTDDVCWSRITKVSLVCFVADPDLEAGARVALYADQGRWVIPSDGRLPGEDVWDDSALRIPLQCMGFRRQGTHLLAIDARRRHCVLWIDGNAYSGWRTHRKDAKWWTGPAVDAAELLRGQGDGALAQLVELADHERRTISYEQSMADLRRTLVGSYLRADTLAGGSGFGGTAQEWESVRGVLADAIDTTRDEITFLDLGCANGHLAQSMINWGADRGVVLTSYGVDIAPELVARAQELHPQLADHFWVGDASTWRHPTGQRFDLVHMLLDVIPVERHSALVEHLMTHLVAPGGRLLLSRYGQSRPSMSARSLVERLGRQVAGETRAPQRPGRRELPSVWITA
ncbi:MAG: class I SAM-dependent methyltransferase [Propionibacteriales bacterium]|nr:class I SAM-dependent methyltransferase [Propionibacteriales bacterium]